MHFQILFDLTAPARTHGGLANDRPVVNAFGRAGAPPFKSPRLPYENLQRRLPASLNFKRQTGAALNAKTAKKTPRAQRKDKVHHDLDPFAGLSSCHQPHRTKVPCSFSSDTDVPGWTNKKPLPDDRQRP